MSLREREQAYESLRNSENTYNIGVFVIKYQRLVELLLPISVAWDAILYVTRWCNYLLSFAVMLILCGLFYYPVLFLVCLSVLSIVMMCVGRYYSQSRLLTLQRLREPPVVYFLDQDQQILRRLQKEQRNSHRNRVEFTQILRRTENLIAAAINFLQHLYGIILWRSVEVSLCVTILLSMFLLLLCAVHLRTIVASLPLIVFCTNRHFVKRTVDMWKLLWNYGYTRIGRYRAKWMRSTTSRGAPVAATVRERAPEESSRVQSLSLSSEESIPLATTSQDQAAGGGTDSDSDEPKPKPAAAVRADTQGSSLPLATPGGAQAAENGPKLELKVPPANCAKCGVSFAKLLKRKHNCNYCGQTFCGSCTAKVKRALLGATSPAAFEESVRVCLECKLLLDNLNTNTEGLTSSAVR